MAAAFFALSASGVRLSPRGLLGIAVMLSGMALGLLHAKRRVFMFNSASARRTVATVTFFAYLVLFALFGYLQDAPPTRTLQYLALAHSILAMVLGVTYSRLFLVGVPVYPLVAALFALRPDDGFFNWAIYCVAQGAVNRAEAWLLRRKPKEQ
jgi:hypothetical protein